MRTFMLALILLPTLALADCHHYAVVIVNLTKKAWVLDQLTTTRSSITRADHIIPANGVGTIEFSDFSTRATRYVYFRDIKSIIHFRESGNKDQQFAIKAEKSACSPGVIWSDSGEIRSTIRAGGEHVRLVKHVQPRVDINAEAVSIYEIYE